MQQAFYGGQSPWQYEALYINRAKLVVKTSGMALSREMAEMVYSVDYYIHVETRENAVRLVQHMPYRGHTLTVQEVNSYAGPVIEQAVNQLVQITPLESVNEKIHDLSQIVYQHLQQFLADYGISLDTVKVLVFPRDERMKALISLKAFGLSELDAVRYYTAMMMAERGVVSAPNMAIGLPFNISGVTTTASTDRYTLNPPEAPLQPPRTRSNPDPPKEALAQVLEIQAAQQALSDLETAIRGMAVPVQDRIWWRFRQEETLLRQLLQFDLALVRNSEQVY